MADIGIMYSSPMVLALLAGRKTQTRRVLKVSKKMPYQIGDRLWVRESIEPWYSGGADTAYVRYIADQKPTFQIWPEKHQRRKMPGMHMMRKFSRITCLVEDARVELLQDISPDDAIAEGLIKIPFAPGTAKEMGCDWGFGGDSRHGSPVSAYAALWDSLNGDRPGMAWKDNPWVIVATQKVEIRNIDR